MAESRTVLGKRTRGRDAYSEMDVVGNLDDHVMKNRINLSTVPNISCTQDKRENRERPMAAQDAGLCPTYPGSIKTCPSIGIPRKMSVTGTSA
jgi:hypothetical protein